MVHFMYKILGEQSGPAFLKQSECAAASLAEIYEAHQHLDSEMFTTPLPLLLTDSSAMSLHGPIFVDPGTVYLKLSFGILCFSATATRLRLIPSALVC